VSGIAAQESRVFHQVGACDTRILGNWLDIQGSLAYVSTLHGLAVVDVTDPRNPQCHAGLDFGSAWEIDVAGEFAYMLSGGIVVVDIGHEGEYRIVGRYTTPSRYTDVKVKNQYMFLTALRNGLEIVDVSNPAMPTAVSGFSETRQYSEEWMGYVHLDVHGDIVYLGESEHGLTVIDVSAIEHPVRIRTVAFDGPCTDVLVENDRLFVGTFDGLILYDISDPRTPVQIGVLTDYGRPAHLTADGSLLVFYHDDDPYRLVAVDVSDPASPVVIGQHDTYSHDLFFDGRYVYSTGEQFRVFELSDRGDTRP